MTQYSTLLSTRPKLHGRCLARHHVTLWISTGGIAREPAVIASDSRGCGLCILKGLLGMTELDVLVWYGARVCLVRCSRLAQSTRSGTGRTRLHKPAQTVS